MAYVTADSYWKIVPDDFFVNVSIIPQLKGGLFVFFSEEPDYVEQYIVPQCIEKNKDFKYCISKSYGSYYGYKDLFLLSKCNIFVKSQGSFGLYAYFISTNTNKKLICYDETAPNLWKYA